MTVRIDITFHWGYVLLGTTAEGVRVLVIGELYRLAGPHSQQTVTHEQVESPENLNVLTVVFTGQKDISRNAPAGVHPLEHFGPQIVSPGPGYTLAEVRELIDLGLRWYDNTRRKAGCVHMDTPEGDTQRARLSAGVTCPVTGQLWGSARYAEVLPDKIRGRFIELMKKGATQGFDYSKSGAS